MRRTKQVIPGVLVVGLVLVVIACAPAAAPAVPAAPTVDAAMMAKETDTAMMQATDTAMMAKETDTAMMQATDTAMMAKETDTAMMQATDTAMMAKETDTAMMQATDTAMMAKETDTAMMAHETDAAMSPTTEAMASGTDTAMNHDEMMTDLPPEQFAAHFVDSMPMQGDVVAEIPKLIQLNFNFTLSDASTITVEKDGKEILSQPGKLDEKRLAMTTELPADAGAGVYVVKYKACWPDNSCHNGQFAFVAK